MSPHRRGSQCRNNLAPLPPRISARSTNMIVAASTGLNVVLSPVAAHKHKMRAGSNRKTDMRPTPRLPIVQGPIFLDLDGKTL